MSILAFKASICLQKSNLYYSNSSFHLAQNITYLRPVTAFRIWPSPDPSLQQFQNELLEYVCKLYLVSSTKHAMHLVVYLSYKALLYTHSLARAR